MRCPIQWQHCMLCCSAMDTPEKESEGLVIIYDALLMPADISEQTESIRAKRRLRSQLQLGQNRFGQQSIFLPLSGFSSCGYNSSFPCGIMQRCMRLRRCQHKKGHWPDFHGAMEQPLGRLPSDMHIGQWAQV